MKKGFTPAELLIALAIVGAISVMTIPTLVSNYRAHVASVRLKKFYSNMRTAIQISEIKNCRAINWDKEDRVYNENGSNNMEENNKNAAAFFDRYLAPYFKYKTKTLQDKSYQYYLPDGSSFKFWNFNCIDIYYDINGNDNKPNKMGADVFDFLNCLDDDMRNAYFGNKLDIFNTYGTGLVKTRKDALKQCKQAPEYCSTLLMYDGWKLKKDYPYNP
ncbi:MAG: type II secretion system protein [Cyanobacteriota bacterium]|nr:type II secretion system protein [Cyanobacteriota bacterium]MDY6358714.1 type II secretion system protein [Cyanobacteriota bacterium]MDY6363968.1 type II secretion system protein [Cyanobacteriota bacterium]MDY6382835.1 type II secretion system protein [Cyanobacteriota bacterium]